MSIEIRDPVCGMRVSPEKAKHRFEYEGTTYLFCCGGCKTAFEKTPQPFLDLAASVETDISHPAPPSLATAYVCPMCPDVREDEPVPCPSCGMALEPEVSAASLTMSAVEYTCPMHPDVVQSAPGACPQCGMALELRAVTLEEAPNPELADMTRRFWIGAAIGSPVFVLAMAEMVVGGIASRQVSNWVQLLCATPVVVWAGRPFFERCWASIRNRSPNMFTLIGLGVGSAYLYSLAATLFPRAFPDGFRTEGGGVEPYFDTAVVIIVLVLLGQVLELRARHRTGAALRALLRSCARHRPSDRE